MRGDHSEVLRDTETPSMRVVLPHASVLEKLEIQSCWVRDNSPAVGRTAAEFRLRSVTGATVVAVRRDSKLVVNPGADYRFAADDAVFLVGDHQQIQDALCLLDPSYGEAPKR